MARTAEAHDRIAWELNEERVFALRRISQTLEKLIVQVREAGDGLRSVAAADRHHAITIASTSSIASRQT